MKIKNLSRKLRFSLIGVLIGALIGGGLLVNAAIQSEVGINGVTTESGTRTWRPIETSTTNIDTEPTTQAVLLTMAYKYLFNGTSWERGRSAASGESLTGLGVDASAPYVFNGTNFARARTAADTINTAGTSTTPAVNLLGAGLMIQDAVDVAWRSLYNARSIGDGAPGTLTLPNIAYNGTTFDRIRTVGVGDGTTTGILAGGMMAFNGTTWNRIRDAVPGDGVASTGLLANNAYLLNGTNFDRIRSASAVNLTATTSIGANVNVPLSTWSVTHTPAAATQATASKAAGGGTVRHVATTITACFTDTDSADVGTVHLRDGATGAGTILRSWYLNIPAANTSRCQDLSGLAMIGTANTAMTLEFAAAGTANSLETVTLTGFSVP